MARQENYTARAKKEFLSHTKWKESKIRPGWLEYTDRFTPGTPKIKLFQAMREMIHDAGGKQCYDRFCSGLSWPDYGELVLYVEAESLKKFREQLKNEGHNKGG